MKPHARFLKAVLPLLVVAVLLLAACKPQEVVLSFQTIERQDSAFRAASMWGDKNPALMVISSSEDIEKVKSYVTAQSVSTLEQLDFRSAFALVVFRGLQPSSFVDFSVERIVRRGSEIAVYTRPGRQGPNPAESSPYHLVEIQKQGEMSGNFTFNLYFGEDKVTIASGDRNVP